MSRKKLTSQWLKALGAGAVTAGVVDAAWIGGAALKIYESKIPHLMADSVNVLPAALFYTVHLAGTSPPRRRNPHPPCSPARWCGAGRHCLGNFRPHQRCCA